MQPRTPNNNRTSASLSASTYHKLSANLNIIKVLLMGDTKTEKSKFVGCYIEDDSLSHLASLGVNFKQKQIEINGVKRKLFIWDTAGQERFLYFTPAYFQGCNSILLMYSVTDKESFKRAQHWKKQIDLHAPENIPVVLVATHCDQNNREVSKEEGEAFANQHKIPFFECSAEKNVNINEAFDTLAQEVVRREPPSTFLGLGARRTL